MSAAGIGPGMRVVAYDDQAGAMAARLWYLLRAYGHDAVAVLDGGLPKWTAEGRPVETSSDSAPGCVHRTAARGMGPRQGGDGARGPAVSGIGCARARTVPG